MDFEHYQSESRKTAIYPDLGKSITYPVLGLIGEAGEVAEKYKKIIRDNAGKIGASEKDALVKELGDVLWYVAQIATELDVRLAEVAILNLDKLRDRQKRGVLGGSGDRR